MTNILMQTVVLTLKQMWAIDCGIVLGYPYMVGFGTPLAIALAVYMIVNTRRHQCKEEGCGCKTKTSYRMIRINNVRLIKSGLMPYAVFKFRYDKHRHVSVSIKTKLFTHSQINGKPLEVFDWSSAFIIDLCEAAGIDNPEKDYITAQLKNPEALPRLVVIKREVVKERYWPVPKAAPKT